MTDPHDTVLDPKSRWTDYSTDELLRSAFVELERSHGELARVVAAHDHLVEAVRSASKSPSDVRRERIASRKARVARARQRLQSKQIGLVEYLRIRIWIAAKSHKVDSAGTRHPSLEEILLDPMKSQLLGDSPVRQATVNSQYLTATTWAMALEHKHGGNPGFLELCRQLAVKRGNISAVLAYTHQLAKLGKTNSRAIRQVEGRLREISGWIPRIPGVRTEIEPIDKTTVLHLVKESRPYHSNGFTSRSHNNFRAELAAGLKPVVLTELGFPRSEVGDEFPDVEFLDGIPHYRLDMGSGYNAASVDQWLEDFAWAAYQKVKELRPAVIHVSSGRRGYETALVGLALREKTGLPLVYEVRSFFEGTWTGETEAETDGETFARRMAVEKMCMDAADYVLTIGEAMKAEIIDRGVPANKIGVVPNGVDLSRFVPVEDSEDLRIDLKIKGFTFGYVSNMDHRRESQETLIDAARILRDRGCDFQCILVGSGARRDYLEEYATEAGVRDQIIFTGAVDHEEIARYYALIDVFVVPRIRERASTYVTPLKPYEAMAMGKAILASDLPALSEILDPPHRGLVFEPGDIEALADKIELLANDDEARTRLGLAGRTWLRANRQWAQNGPIYSEVFRKVQEGQIRQDVTGQ